MLNSLYSCSFLLFTSMVQVSAGCCSVGEMVSFLFFQL